MGDSLKSGGTYLLVVRPSLWKVLMYLEISLAFVVAGAIMLLFPASEIHPTPLNPAPPALVRVFGIVSVSFGLIGIYMIVRFAGQTVVSVSRTEIYYPREHYTLSIADIKEIRCYRYYMLRNMQARMIAVRVKDPEKYTHLIPRISRWGANMLGADLYLNLSVASDKSFDKTCETLKNIGVPVSYAVYEKHSFKELRKKWGYIIGSQVWLSERIPIEVDVVAFTLMLAGFIALWKWTL